MDNCDFPNCYKKTNEINLKCSHRFCNVHLKELYKNTKAQNKPQQKTQSSIKNQIFCPICKSFQVISKQQLNVLQQIVQEDISSGATSTTQMKSPKNAQQKQVRSKNEKLSSKEIQNTEENLHTESQFSAQEVELSSSQNLFKLSEGNKSQNGSSLSQEDFQLKSSLTDQTQENAQKLQELEIKKSESDQEQKKESNKEQKIPLNLNQQEQDKSQPNQEIQVKKEEIFQSYDSQLNQAKYNQMNELQAKFYGLDYKAYNEVIQVFQNLQEQGKISKNKLGYAFRATRKILSEEKLQEIVNSIPRDFVDKETFIETYKSIPDVNPNEIQIAFDVLDEGKQGKISLDILDQVLQKENQVINKLELEEELKAFIDGNNMVDYTKMVQKLFPEI